MILGAHQPNFLPYLGFFDKLIKSDIFVIRDEVQFVKRSWQHRNRIKINVLDENGNPRSKWITVPVGRTMLPIRDIAIKNDVKRGNKTWSINILNQIEDSYCRTPFFKECFPQIKEILLTKYVKLIDLNMSLINFLKDSLNIEKEFIYASSLNIEKVDANTDLINICKAVKADIYLSGQGAKKYLDESLFEKKGIKVIYNNFEPSAYKQLGNNFIPNLSIVDVIFNIGLYETRRLLGCQKLVV